MPTDEVALCCYGVEVRLVDAAGLELDGRLRAELPPEFGTPAATAEAAVSYAVTAPAPPEAGAAPEYLVTCDGAEAFAAAAGDEVYWWLRQDIDQAVAQRSPRLLFVHAGVVGWRGVAIVIPGRGSVGKSRLVVELVRRGAAYYSDAFAVLDEGGRVHPYRGPIGLGDEDQRHDLRLVREDEPAGPLPIGLIVVGSYRPGAAWRPAIVRGAHAALPLVDSTVPARDQGDQATRLRQLAARVAPTLVTLRGPRPEAEEVAPQLLDLVDDALVSHALGAGNGSGGLADDLARVAEVGLQTDTDRPVSPPRRLVAARYARVTDFLSPAGYQHLLDHVLTCETDFHESGVTGPEGQGELDLECRGSRILASARLEEVWDLFDRRLRAILPFIRQQLRLWWVPLGRIERELTARGSGRSFAPHVDTGDPAVARRRISCIYSFHRRPQRFTGGELKLYDTWVTPTGSTGAGTYTTLPPLANSMLFFPSDVFHEVCPVQVETDAFADSPFTVTIRVWQGERPAQVRGAESPA